MISVNMLSERSQSAIPESGGLVLGCGGRIQSGGANPDWYSLSPAALNFLHKELRPPFLIACSWRHTQQTYDTWWVTENTVTHKLISFCSFNHIWFLNTIHLSSFAVHSWLLNEGCEGVHIGMTCHFYCVPEALDKEWVSKFDTCSTLGLINCT